MTPLRAARERVAVTLAEPLRMALDAHLSEHGCGEGGEPWFGFIHCPDAERLYRLLPAVDRIRYGTMTLNDARRDLGLLPTSLATQMASQCSYCRATTAGERCRNCGAPR